MPEMQTSKLLDEANGYPYKQNGLLGINRKTAGSGKNLLALVDLYNLVNNAYDSQIGDD